MATKQRYRLLAGSHAQDEVVPGHFDEQGRPVKALRTYYTPPAGPAAIVESETDLVKRFGVFMDDGVTLNSKFPQKFELVVDQPYRMNQESQGPISAEEAARRGFDSTYATSGAYLAPQQIQPHQNVAMNQPKGTLPPDAVPGTDLQRSTDKIASVQNQGAQVGRQHMVTDQATRFAMLDKMTEKELRVEAEDNEIDLNGAKGRDEVLKRLKAHYQKQK